MNKKEGDQMARKVFVSVLLTVDTNGKNRPYRIKFEDDPVYENQVFKVDRVKDVRRAASLKVGGTGIRYTVIICGKESYLFNDENKWFVEAKK